jgi:hypothetical protein
MLEYLYCYDRIYCIIFEDASFLSCKMMMKTMKLCLPQFVVLKVEQSFFFAS